MLGKVFLSLQIVVYTIASYAEHFLRLLNSRSIQKRREKYVGSQEKRQEDHNIVIIGASFAGYHAAKILAESLPADSPYQVVVIEPNSHFQFTWLLPRFSIVSGHEEKLFIPYGPYIKTGIDRVRWIRDRAVDVTRETIKLRDSPEQIPYRFLLLATGSGQTNGLPSRVGAEDREKGIKMLQELQRQVREAENIVVVGGGAAGVELAADAKESYPQKNIAIVHPRSGLMHRFEPGLQNASRSALEKLGIEVILDDRVIEHSQCKTAVLKSGRKLQCDLLIDCVGQRPSSDILSNLSPEAIAESGHVRVNPTLQILDDTLPNVYACGDVAEVKVPKPNARAAMRQAMIVADNIVLATQGKTYDSVVHFGNGQTELLRPTKEKKITLMADETWIAMGVSPDIEAV